MNATEGIWLSISDYSRYKAVSVSTIRRHIKNNILKYKEEDGKYFIYTPSLEKVKLREDEEILRAKFEIELLKSEIRQLQEENSELRMLVDIYENNNSNPVIIKDIPPEIPVSL